MVNADPGAATSSTEATGSTAAPSDVTPTDATPDPTATTAHDFSPYATLREHIHAVKQRDPFRRCTVVIPHRAVAYDVARALGGTINVRALTLLDLAQEIVDDAGTLIGRTPLTETALRSAMADALAADPLGFADVADQPTTLDALTEASTRLLRAEHLDAASLPGITRDVIDLHRRALAQMADSFTAQDVFAEATRTLASEAGYTERLGQVVLFQLPIQHDAIAREFVAVLARGAHQIPPARYDETVVRTSIDALVSVTDPVEEARFAVEQVASALASGEVSAGHRIGVFFPVQDPYLGLATSQLAQAGIAFTARGLTPATAFPPARHLLALLDLDPEEPDLRTVLDAHWEGVLAAGDGRLPPTRRAEKAYVFGMDPDAREDEYARADWDLLTGYRDRLAAHLRGIDAAPTWADAATALRRMGEDLLHRAAYTPEDRRGHRTLDAALQALADVDPAAPSPGREDLTRHLASELVGRSSREGSLNTGVVVGSLPSAVGRDLDLVIVLGMADGIAPAPSTIDPLFPMDAAEYLGGGMLSQRALREDQRDQFAAALAAGHRTLVTTPRGRLRVSGPLFLSPWIAPHSALRADSATDGEGQDLEAQLPGLAHLRAVHRVFDSPLAAARDGYGDAALPATRARGWHRALLRQASPGADGPGARDEGTTSPAAADTAPTDSLPESAADARCMRADRRAGVFSRFTGNLGTLAASLPADVRGFRVVSASADAQQYPISPTGLELWANDPFTYFLERVLGAELFAYPDEEEQADPLLLGTIVHAALERVVLAQLDTGAVPSPQQVASILETVFREHERSSWSQVLWQAQQHRARAMVGRAVESLRAGADPSTPPEDRFRPLGAESSFGDREEAGHDLLEVPIAPGQSVFVRGSVDRIDEVADGSLRVIDYKTGKSDGYKGIVGEVEGRTRRGGVVDPFDPTAGGTKLQLPLYALHALRDHVGKLGAARGAELGGDGATAATALAVEYHFVAEDPTQRIGFDWIDEVHEEFRHQLARISDAIGRGIFPIRAGEPQSHRTWQTWYGVMGEREHWRLGRSLARDRTIQEATDATTLQQIREHERESAEPEADLENIRDEAATMTEDDDV